MIKSIVNLLIAFSLLHLVHAAALDVGEFGEPLYPMHTKQLARHVHEYKVDYYNVDELGVKTELRYHVRTHHDGVYSLAKDPNLRRFTCHSAARATLEVNDYTQLLRDDFVRERLTLTTALDGRFVGCDVAHTQTPVYLKIDSVLARNRTTRTIELATHMVYGDGIFQTADIYFNHDPQNYTREFHRELARKRSLFPIEVKRRYELCFGWNYDCDKHETKELDKLIGSFGGVSLRCDDCNAHMLFGMTFSLKIDRAWYSEPYIEYFDMGFYGKFGFSLVGTPVINTFLAAKLWKKTWLHYRLGYLPISVGGITVYAVFHGGVKSFVEAKGCLPIQFTAGVKDWGLGLKVGFKYARDGYVGPYLHPIIDSVKFVLKTPELYYSGQQSNEEFDAMAARWNKAVVDNVYTKSMVYVSPLAPEIELSWTLIPPGVTGHGSHKTIEMKLFPVEFFIKPLIGYLIKWDRTKCQKGTLPGIKGQLVWGVYSGMRIGVVEIEINKPWEWSFSLGIEGAIPLRKEWQLKKLHVPSWCGDWCTKCWLYGGNKKSKRQTSTLDEYLETGGPGVTSLDQLPPVDCGDTAVKSCAECLARGAECGWCGGSSSCLATNSSAIVPLTCADADSWRTSSCRREIARVEDAFVVSSTTINVPAASALIVDIPNDARSYALRVALEPVALNESSSSLNVIMAGAGLPRDVIAASSSSFQWQPAAGVAAGTWRLTLTATTTTDAAADLNPPSWSSEPFDVAVDSQLKGWILSVWGACSRACGVDGRQQRRWMCVGGGGDVAAEATVCGGAPPPAGTDDLLERACLPSPPSECVEHQLSILSPDESDVVDASGRIQIKWGGGARYQPVHVEYLSPTCTEWKLLYKSSDGAAEGITGYDWAPSVRSYHFAAEAEQRRQKGNDEPLYTLIRVVSAIEFPYKNRAITRVPVEVRVQFDSSEFGMAPATWRVTGKEVGDAAERVDGVDFGLRLLISTEDAAVRVESTAAGATFSPTALEEEEATTFYVSQEEQAAAEAAPARPPLDLRWPTSVTIEGVLSNENVLEVYFKPSPSTGTNDVRKFRVVFYDPSAPDAPRPPAADYANATLPCFNVNGAWTCALERFKPTTTGIPCAWVDGGDDELAYDLSTYVDLPFDPLAATAEETFEGGFRGSKGDDDDEDSAFNVLGMSFTTLLIVGGVLACCVCLTLLCCFSCLVRKRRANRGGQQHVSRFGSGSHSYSSLHGSYNNSLRGSRSHMVRSSQSTTRSRVHRAPSRNAIPPHATVNARYPYNPVYH